MLADMADQPALYQPTEFWKAASASIMDELNQEGFANFRSLSSARSYFAPSYGPPGNTMSPEDVRALRSCFFNRTPGSTRLHGAVPIANKRCAGEHRKIVV